MPKPMRKHASAEQVYRETRERQHELELGAERGKRNVAANHVRRAVALLVAADANSMHYDATQELKAALVYLGQPWRQQ